MSLFTYAAVNHRVIPPSRGRIFRRVDLVRAVHAVMDKMDYGLCLRNAGIRNWRWVLQKTEPPVPRRKGTGLGDDERVQRRINLVTMVNQRTASAKVTRFIRRCTRSSSPSP